MPLAELKLPHIRVRNRSIFDFRLRNSYQINYRIPENYCFGGIEANWYAMRNVVSLIDQVTIYEIQVWIERRCANSSADRSLRFPRAHGVPTSSPGLATGSTSPALLGGRNRAGRSPLPLIRCGYGSRVVMRPYGLEPKVDAAPVKRGNRGEHDQRHCNGIHQGRDVRRVEQGVDGAECDRLEA